MDTDRWLDEEEDEDCEASDADVEEDMSRRIHISSI